MVRGAGIFSVVLAAAALAATAGGAPAPKVWYWTQSKAEQVVVAKVRLSDCSVFPDHADCRPSMLWRVRTANCVGANERAQTFTYPRFTCEVTVTDYYGRPLSQGRLAVYPSGPLSLRWKILD